MGAEEGVRGAHGSPSEVTLDWCAHTLFSFCFLGMGRLFIDGEWCLGGSFPLITF